MRSCERKWYRANNTADFSVDLLCLCCGLGLLSRGDSRVDLLAILPSDTGRGSTVAATLTRTDTDDCMISSLIHQVFEIMIICRYTPCEWIAHETQYAILM